MILTLGIILHLVWTTIEIMTLRREVKKLQELSELQGKINNTVATMLYTQKTKK